MAASPLPPPHQPPYETDKVALLQAVLRKASTRMEGTVTFQVPALPALIDYCVPMVRSQWLGLGRRFSQQDLDALRQVMKTEAEAAFAASPFSVLTVVSEADRYPKSSITWRIECRRLTLEERYEEWARSRKPPLFGQNPDAKVMELARSLSTAGPRRVLDAGAGSGRNALPLARLGLETDAVELTPTLADSLRQAIRADNLALRVFDGDILDAALPLPRNYYQLVVLSEVVSHFRSVDDLRRLFLLSEQLLTDGGTLVFNSFVARPGYEPDTLARELSLLTWSCLFTDQDLREAVAGRAFELVSNESAQAFEKTRALPGEWPPTGWFEAWSSGAGLFDLPLEKCPMELRWLVYRKRQ